MISLRDITGHGSDTKSIRMSDNHKYLAVIDIVRQVCPVTWSALRKRKEWPPAKIKYKIKQVFIQGRKMIGIHIDKVNGFMLFIMLVKPSKPSRPLPIRRKRLQVVIDIESEDELDRVVKGFKKLKIL